MQFKEGAVTPVTGSHLVFVHKYNDNSFHYHIHEYILIKESFMEQRTQPGIAIRYESKLISRNVRPVNEILQEFEQKEILHTTIDPAEMKYGNWDIVIEFADQKNYDQFKSGQLKLDADWLSGGQAQEQRINPLKASKRAAGGT